MAAHVHGAPVPWRRRRRRWRLPMRPGRQRGWRWPLRRLPGGHCPRRRRSNGGGRGRRLRHREAVGRRLRYSLAARGEVPGGAGRAAPAEMRRPRGDHPPSSGQNSGAQVVEIAGSFPGSLVLPGYPKQTQGHCTDTVHVPCWLDVGILLALCSYDRMCTCAPLPVLYSCCTGTSLVLITGTVLVLGAEA